MDLRKNHKISIWIKKLEKSAIYESVFGLLVFLLFVTLMFKKADARVYLVIGVIALLFYLTLYMYGGTVRRVQIVNRTIDHIMVNDGTLAFETFGYSIFGLKKKPPLNKTALLTEVTITNKKYPILDKEFFRSVSCKSIQISGTEYYLLYESIEGGEASYAQEIINKLEKLPPTPVQIKAG